MLSKNSKGVIPSKSTSRVPCLDVSSLDFTETNMIKPSLFTPTKVLTLLGYTLSHKIFLITIPISVDLNYQTVLQTSQLCSFKVLKYVNQWEETTSLTIKQIDPNSCSPKTKSFLLFLRVENESKDVKQIRTHFWQRGILKRKVTTITKAFTEHKIFGAKSSFIIVTEGLLFFWIHFTVYYHWNRER